jgi:glycine hydroxymethyltransferase
MESQTRMVVGGGGVSCSLTTSPRRQPPVAGAFRRKGLAFGNMIIEVLDGLTANGDDGNGDVEASVKNRATALCERFPIYR